MTVEKEKKRKREEKDEIEIEKKDKQDKKERKESKEKKKKERSEKNDRKREKEYSKEKGKKEEADSKKEKSKNEQILHEDSSIECVKSFSDFSFPPHILSVLSKFSEPTPIQNKCWHPCLEGRDLVGIAETGSGKTFAFAVPAIIKLLKDEKASQPHNQKKKMKKIPTVLVLSPTRELAQQIQNSFEELCVGTTLTSVVVYGGVSKIEQRAAVQNANIVVATPGRLLDLLHEESLDISKISYFVLDEADRMLDMGFEKDVRKIFEKIKLEAQERQTLMFSATWPQTIQDMANQYLNNPIKIAIGSVDLNANHNVSQTIMVLSDDRQKESKLLELLKQYHSTRQNRVLIFALYKKEADRIEQLLVRNGWKVVSLHGDKSQAHRNEAIESFRTAKCPLMVATDVAARGLDIPDVEYVINVSFPLTVEDYVHRIGRTGRGGKKGSSFTFFTPHDRNHSGGLINILREAKQHVPDDLLAFGATVKKKEHKDYGAFYKPIDPNVKATHVKFDD